MPGLSGDTYSIDQLLPPTPFDIHAPQQGGFSQASIDPLSSLSELSYLETVPLPLPTFEDYQYTDPATWFLDQSTSPSMGLLQVSLPNETHEGPAVYDDHAGRTADAKHDVRAVARQ